MANFVDRSSYRSNYPTRTVWLDGCFNYCKMALSYESILNEHYMFNRINQAPSVITVMINNFLAGGN